MTLRNPRTGEVWVCEDYRKRRNIDGLDFIEVHPPESINRTVWIALDALAKVKDNKTLKSVETNKGAKNAN